MWKRSMAAVLAALVCAGVTWGAEKSEKPEGKKAPPAEAKDRRINNCRDY
jgi:hypothetical protein